MLPAIGGSSRTPDIGDQLATTGYWAWQYQGDQLPRFGPSWVLCEFTCWNGYISPLLRACRMDCLTLLWRTINLELHKELSFQPWSPITQAGGNSAYIMSSWCWQ